MIDWAMGFLFAGAGTAHLMASYVRYIRYTIRITGVLYRSNTTSVILWVITWCIVITIAVFWAGDLYGCCGIIVGRQGIICILFVINLLFILRVGLCFLCKYCGTLSLDISNSNCNCDKV